MSVETAAPAHVVRHRADNESRALIIAAVVFALTLIIAFISFWGRDLPIAQHDSLGEFISIAGAIAAALGFIIGRVLVQREHGDDGLAHFRWFDIIALALGHAVIALLGWLGIASVMASSFTGATLYPSPAAVIAAVTTALSAYISYLSAVNLTPRQLSLVLAVFLVVGIVAAMLSASDPLWWHHNLSALGMTHDLSSFLFNVTLILSGIMVTTIARFGTSSLPTATALQRKHRLILRILFVALGILLALVGVFPVDRFFLIHNTVATGMAVVFGALVIALPWLVPTMPRVFLWLGFIFLVAIAVFAVLFAVGIYNLTAVELVASMLIFGWIIVFLRNVQSMAEAEASSHSPIAHNERS